jgi:DNA-binding MarR family transcriptional regulator
VARPDTDDGWIKVAHELDAALAFADFTKAQRVILHFIFAQAFQTDATNRRVFDLSPSDLAKRFGLDKGTIGHALADFVSNGVLVRKAPGRYAFVKDYERWQRAGQRRFKPADLARIKAAPSRAAEFRKELAPQADATTPLVNQPTMLNNVGQRANNVGQPANAVGQPANAAVGQPANDSLVNQPTKSCSPPTPPPLSGGRIEEGRREGRKEEARALDSVKALEPDPEVVRVARLADRLDPHQNGGWAQKVHQFAGMYSPAWILAACEATAAAGKGDWRYVHRILQRYRAQGGPDAAPTGREPIRRPEPPGPIIPRVDQEQMRRDREARKIMQAAHAAQRLAEKQGAASAN